jgi:hypothetical protein
VDGVQGLEGAAKRTARPVQDDFRNGNLVYGGQESVQLGGAQGEVRFGQRPDGTKAMQSPPDFDFQQFTRDQSPLR